MKTSLIASLALALLAAPAFADDDDDDRPGRGNGVPPGLADRIDIDEDLDLDLDDNLDIARLAGSLNGQINLSDVTSKLDATVGDVGGASLTAASIGNSASATAVAAGSGLGSLLEDGQGNFAGITSDLTATVEGTDEELAEVQGEISATSAAIGNSASLSVGGLEAGVQSKLGQLNTGVIAANATVTAGGAQRAVAATAAAIGNSLSLVNGIVE